MTLLSKHLILLIYPVITPFRRNDPGNKIEIMNIRCSWRALQQHLWNPSSLFSFTIPIPLPALSSQGWAHCSSLTSVRPSQWGSALQHLWLIWVGIPISPVQNTWQTSQLQFLLCCTPKARDSKVWHPKLFTSICSFWHFFHTVLSTYPHKLVHERLHGSAVLLFFSSPTLSPTFLLLLVSQGPPKYLSYLSGLVPGPDTIVLLTA